MNTAERSASCSPLTLRKLLAAEQRWERLSVYSTSYQKY